MKKELLIIILFFGSIELIGQGKQDTLLLNRKLSFNTIDYWKYMNQEHAALSYCLLYNVVNFPSASANDFLNEKWSFSFRARLTVLPFILDGDMFTSKFNVDNIYQIPLYQPEEYSLFQRFGYNISLSVCPLPRINRISEIIVPYLGFGYQWSELAIENNNDEVKPYPTMDLSAWIWKVGGNIYFDNLPFNVIIEYEQTINRDKRRNFSFLSFGVSFTLLGSNSFKGKMPKIYVY